jgi:septal ring factor EnvC (AmiA/AmiB activator)
MFGSKTPEDPKPAQPAPAPAQRVQPAVSKPSPGGYIWPVKGQVVATFQSGWHQACHGLEIAAPEGTPVCAARAGTVLLAQAFPGYGNLILVDHGDGYATAYGYNRQMVVRAGQRVERGQVIGSVGRASQGAESRLHFQVRRNALPIDPMQFLKNK